MSSTFLPRPGPGFRESRLAKKQYATPHSLVLTPASQSTPINKSEPTPIDDESLSPAEVNLAKKILVDGILTSVKTVSQTFMGRLEQYQICAVKAAKSPNSAERNMLLFLSISNQTATSSPKRSQLRRQQFSHLSTDNRRHPNGE